jgi:sugar phosphate permease
MTMADVLGAPSRRVGEQGESRVNAWSVTLVLFALYVVNWGDKAVLGLVAQPLSRELGLSASHIGLVGSGFFLTFTVGGFFAGLLNKWMTLRWLMVLLSLTWAATMLPMVVVASFAFLLASRLALGLFEGPAGAIIHTAAYSWHPPEKRGLPSAWLTSGASMAKIAVAPGLAVIVATLGWRAAFIALAIVGVAWCALWLVIWKEGPYGQHPESRPATVQRATEQPQNTVAWTRIFRTRTFLGGLVAVFAMYALVSAVLTWLPSYFEVGLGYSRLQAGTMFGFPSIAALVAMFLSTFLSDRLLSRGASSRLLRGVLPGIGLLLCGSALVLVPVIDVPAVAVAVVSIGYGVGSMIFPLINAGISQICAPKQLAGTLGTFMALMSIGGLIGPYLTGVIVDAASSPAAGYATAFQVFGIGAIVASVIALIMVNPERDARRLLG